MSEESKMVEEDELKLCPFCGGQGVVKEHGVVHCYNAERGDCFLEGAFPIKSWNTRVASSVARGLVDAVEKYMQSEEAACYPKDCDDPNLCGEWDEKDTCEIAGLGNAFAAFREETGEID